MLCAKVAPAARRILVIGENRLLQQYRPEAEIPAHRSDPGEALVHEMPARREIRLRSPAREDPSHGRVRRSAHTLRSARPLSLRKSAVVL